MTSKPFEPKGKFYVREVPKTSYFLEDGTEDMACGWHATLEDAIQAATREAQKNTNLSTFGVFQPMHTVVRVPPDVTTVALV
jgi:hypothetical protein